MRSSVYGTNSYRWRSLVVSVLSTDNTKITHFLQYTSPTVASDFPCATCTYASRLPSPPVTSPYVRRWQVGWNEGQKQEDWKWKQVKLRKVGGVRWTRLVWQIRSVALENMRTWVWKCMSSRGDGLLRLTWDFKRGQQWSLPVFHLLRVVIFSF